MLLSSPPPSSNPARERLAQRLVPSPLCLAHARRDLIKCSLEVLDQHHHGFGARLGASGTFLIHLPQRAQCPTKRPYARLPHERSQIGAAVPLAALAADHLRNMVRRREIRRLKRDAAADKQRAHDLGALVWRGQVYAEKLVEPPGAAHRRVEHVRTDRRAEDEDAAPRIETVELGEERVDDARRGLGQGLVAPQDERIELVKKDDARRRRARTREHLPHCALALPDVLRHPVISRLLLCGNARHARHTLLSSSGPFTLMKLA